MASLQEILKNAGIKDEVIAGLPPEVVTSLTGYAADADTRLSAAEKALLEANDLKTTLDSYTESEIVPKLTRAAEIETKLAAYEAAVAKAKEQGFNIELPNLPGGNPPAAVPGSPARGGNVAPGFDPAKFQNVVGSVIAQVADVSNEYQRLYGTPMPDNFESLAAEAERMHKPIFQYAAEKYKFADRKQQKAQEIKDAELKAAREAGKQEAAKEFAERGGNNPNLRRGVDSRFPQVKRTTEEVANIRNMPDRQRIQGITDRVKAQIREAHSA